MLCGLFNFVFEQMASTKLSISAQGALLFGPLYVTGCLQPQPPLSVLSALCRAQSHCA